jgi:hypothetical protein
MSYTEVNMREGLPYGGMPYETSLWRMEETDPALVRRARANRPDVLTHADLQPYGNGDGDDDASEAFDDGDGYDGYVRAEIIDRTPDPAYMESDHQRRDPSLSRSQINVRYNGNRGNYDYLPLHAEIFYGFTDNDPRGAQLDPLLNEARGQMTARAETVTVRMGDNDDNHIAERPWTAQSISYGMKEVQRRASKNLKVFSTTREGRPWGRNTITDENRFSRGNTARRRDAVASGAEGLATEGARFKNSETTEASAEGAAPRLADGGVAAGGEAAGPWRLTSGLTKLGTASLSLTRGSGPATAPEAGGSLTKRAVADADWAVTAAARTVNRQLLAASAAVAARYRKAARGSRPDQAAAESYLAQAVGGSAALSDVARAQQLTAADGSTAKQLGTVGDGFAAGRGEKGLRPADDAGLAARHAIAATSRNAHLTNAAAIVSGLREGSASSRRKIAGSVVLGGYREGERAVRAQGTSGRLQDTSLTVRKTDARPGPVAAAAQGLAVHSYASKAPEVRRDVAVGAGAFDSGATWRRSHETVLATGKNPEWRGGKSAADLGTVNMFGRHDTVANPGVVLGKGILSLRATGESHSAEMFDGVRDLDMD